MVFGRYRKDVEVEEKIMEYCGLVGETVAEFKRMIDEYINWDKHFKEQSKKVHRMEHKADELRKHIERSMFAGALLPGYREAYFTTLELLDKVANRAESSGDTLFLLRPDIPEPIRRDFIAIADLTVKAYAPIPDAFRKVMDGEVDLTQEDQTVERHEQEIDKLQFNAIRFLFKESEMSKVDALMAKMLLDEICNVSDRIENAMDRLVLMALKRTL